MDKEKLCKELTNLFATKLQHNVRFPLLFILEDNVAKNKLEIKFLNENHRMFMLSNLSKEIFQIISPDEVIFSNLNLKVEPLTLKRQEIEVEYKKANDNNEKDNEIKKKEDENITIENVVVKKEKILLPIAKNRTIIEIENFILDEFKKITEKQNQIRKDHIDEDYLSRVEYIELFGETTFIVKLRSYLQEMKDYYDEDNN